MHWIVLISSFLPGVCAASPSPLEENSLRASLYRLGYSNPLRQPLHSHLNSWENHGPTRSFLLPTASHSLSFDVSYVQERYDIPLQMRPLVADYIKFFQGAGRKWFVRWLGRSTRYVPLMRPILEKAQLPKDTVYLAMIESGFSPHAYSWAHAVGPWQFIPTTGAYYGLKQNFWVDERRDFVKSTQAAARYLADLYRKLGDWHLAWAAYNAGETRVRRLMERHQAADFWELSESSNLAKETKHYVPKLIAAALLAKHPVAFGFSYEEISFQPPFEFDEVLLETAADLTLLAQHIDAPLENLQELNPELLHLYTPPASPQQPYALRLPKGSLPAFSSTWLPLSLQEKLNLPPRRVRKGETLRKLAATAQLPPEALAEFNRLPNNTPLRPGQTLFLPNPLRLHASSRPYPQAKRPLVYRVARGDSLWSIARKFNVDVKTLQNWNRSTLSKHKTLQPGAKLNVWTRPK